MGRSSCCPKEGLNRGAWTAHEDKILIDYIQTHGEGRWSSLPKRAGLKRCGKSCRLRWVNYLRPDIKRGNITPDEEELIIRLHKLLGNRWSLIAGRLPGRTDNEIKNYWNTNLGKRVVQDHVIPSSSPTRKQRQNQATRSGKAPDTPLLIKNADSSSCANVDVIRTKAVKCTKTILEPIHVRSCQVQTPESDDLSSTDGSFSSFPKRHGGENNEPLLSKDLMMDLDLDLDNISCDFSFSDVVNDFGFSGLSSSGDMLRVCSRDGGDCVADDEGINLCSFTSFLDTGADWLYNNNSNSTI